MAVYQRYRLLSSSTTHLDRGAAVLSIFLFVFGWCGTPVVQDVVAFLPGVSPKDWKPGETVEVKVASLDSLYTQTPRNIYDFAFCRPQEIKKDISNLGDMLMGATLQNTPYRVEYRTDVSCRKVCDVSMTFNDVYEIRRIIDQHYRIHWQVDCMFSIFALNGGDGSEVPIIPTTVAAAAAAAAAYPYGYLVGYEQEGKLYINNHITMTLWYHDTQGDPDNGGRIVGFEVQPNSIIHSIQGDALLCHAKDEAGGPLPLQPVEFDPSLSLFPITFSYDVFWKKSNTPWSTRFSTYLQTSRESPIIHWFAILNSLAVVLLLSAIVAMILIRVLYRDIAKYNEIIIEEGENEESGWKLVHGDVFRKPAHSTVLAALIGSGIQILGMVVVTVLCAAFGLLSSAYRGRLLQSMIFLWALMGAVAGYTSAKFYKMFKSTNWKMTIIRTAVLFPGVVFVIFFLLNLVMQYEGSSAAVPFTGLLTLLVIWFLISTPLVFVGAYLGFRQTAISVPVRVNRIPREIPSQSWFMHWIVSCFIGGSLPFGAMFTELFFLFTSIWQHRFYYLFGFLFLVLMILAVTCAEISLMLVYFQLINEDYKWWWRSFLAPSSSGVYVLVYSVYYYFAKMRLTRISGVLLYFGYSFLIAYGLFILTGSIGFISSFFFLRKIYGSIKVD